MLKFLIPLLLTLYNTHLYAADTLQLQTKSFSKESPMPVIYTCDGNNTSPQFNWSHLPSKTQTLAFIVSDPDAPSGTFYHWVIYNIPKTVTSLPENIKQLPNGAVVAKNSGGSTNYKGPCPPVGESHRYIFSLYALDTKLQLPAGADATSVLSAMKGHIVGQTELTSSYNR